MMAMISSIVILIGGISADPAAGGPAAGHLAADGQRPRELHRRRPARDGGTDRPAARAAAQRRVGPRPDELDARNEGNANIQLNFTWGTDLNEAMNDIRTRIDRVRGRLPEDADPPVIQKFDSNAAPIMGLGAREHRRHARSRAAARARRERPVAAPRARRRASPRSPSAAACAARFTSISRARRSPRSTCRSTASSASSQPRTRTSRSARSTRATAPCCCAARASSRTSSRFATWSC